MTELARELLTEGFCVLRSRELWARVADSCTGAGMVSSHVSPSSLLLRHIALGSIAV